MELVGGLHWVEDPETSSLLDQTTTTPNPLTSFGVSLLSDIAAGVSSLFLFRNPLSLCLRTQSPFVFINLSSPFAVVGRLRNIIATTDFFYPPHDLLEAPDGFHNGCIFVL
jgi:hypothetical protein